MHLISPIRQQSRKKRVLRQKRKKNKMKIGICKIFSQICQVIGCLFLITINVAILCIMVQTHFNIDIISFLESILGSAPDNGSIVASSKTTEESCMTADQQQHAILKAI